MYLQICVQIYVTSVLFTGLFSTDFLAKVRKQSGMSCFPFGNREDQQGKPDKTEREKLCCAEGLVKKENPQKQGHRRADVLEETQHI